MEERIEVRPSRILNIFHYSHPFSQKTAFLFHGLGGRSGQWREQIACLKQEYSLIIPDLFGHGLSDKPKPQHANPYAFTEFNLDMQSLFARFASAENIIIGNSYGGALSVALAQQAEKFVSHLILIAPLPAEPLQGSQLFRYIPLFFLERLRPYFDKKFAELAFDQTASESLLKTEVSAAKENLMYVIKAMVEGLHSIPYVDVSQIKIPSLIMIGENDRILKPKDQEIFYTRIPEHQLFKLKNAGHLLMLEKPQIINTEMIRFLKNTSD